MKILITGGAGYIGNTIAFALSDAGHHPIILDEQPIETVESFTSFDYFQGDIADKTALKEIVDAHPDIDLVIHCAARIDVVESTLKPNLYYDNNFSKSIAMVNHLIDFGINKLILSGTASLYSAEAAYSFNENTLPNPTSPYARSKYFLECALSDISKAKNFKFVIFRYFNPIGSDHKLRAGFRGSNNSSLLNSLVQCATLSKPFRINGCDWDTRDGSTVRDFVDVRDLADAHILAVEVFFTNNASVPLNRFGLPIINLGSEKGVTVKEFVSVFTKATRSDLIVEIGGRRPGDIIGGYASSTIARELLGWTGSTSLETSILNSIRWATKLSST